MSKIYNHTYWDGTTAERYTSRKTFHSAGKETPREEFIGPPTALQKAILEFAEFYRGSK